MRALMRMDDIWLECVVKSRKVVRTALLSTRKTGSDMRWMTAHWIASSSAAISESYDNRLGTSRNGRPTCYYGVQ